MKISSKRLIILKELESILNYKFGDIEILNTALVHSSYANENKLLVHKNNERLEFLGDAVLNLIVSEYLFNEYKESPEGDLTKRRATIVCEPSLAFASRKLELGKYILLGKGEESTGGRKRESILADTFEAILGAIYIDGKIGSAEKFVLNIFDKESIWEYTEGSLFTDYKTELQEVLQKNSNGKIEYKVEKEIGPDHSKRFYIDVIVENKVIGKGMGKNKKEAEQMAAKQALNKIGDKDE